MRNEEMTAQQVKELFGITSFRELSTEKAFHVANKLSELSPDVAKKVIEQFPHCANMIVSLAKDEIDIARQVVDQLGKSTQRHVDVLEKLLDKYEAQLQDESLTFEQVMQINDKMLKVAELIDRANERHHASMMEVLDRVGKTLFSFALIGVCLLVSGNMKVPISMRKGGK